MGIDDSAFQLLELSETEPPLFGADTSDAVKGN